MTIDESKNHLLELIEYFNKGINVRINATDIKAINVLINSIEDLDGKVELLKEQLDEYKHPSEPDSYDIWKEKQLIENDR